MGNGDSTTDDECRKQIALFVSQTEMGTIPNSPAHYLSALACVDRRIRPSNDGMMEVEMHTEQHTEQQSRQCSAGSPSRNDGTQVPECVANCCYLSSVLCMCIFGD